MLPEQLALLFGPLDTFVELNDVISYEKVITDFELSDILIEALNSQEEFIHNNKRLYKRHAMQLVNEAIHEGYLKVAKPFHFCLDPERRDYALEQEVRRIEYQKNKRIRLDGICEVCQKPFHYYRNTWELNLIRKTCGARTCCGVISRKTA